MTSAPRRRVLRVFQGGFDGLNNYAVAAYSWKDAVAAFKACGLHLSLSAARTYGSITANPIQVAAAMANYPEVVWQSKRTTKEPYVVRPRRDA